MASSIKGIFVAVELDQTALKKSVDEATKLLKKEFNNTKEVIDGALDINENKIKSKFTSIAQSIREIQNEIRVGSSGKGMFSSAIAQSDELRREIDSIAKNAGVSADKIRASFSRAFDATSVENTVNAFSRYVKLLQLSNKEAITHAKELGIAGDALSRITDKYQRLESGSFMTSLKNMVTTGNMMAAVQASIATLGANLSIAGGVELGKSMVTTAIRVDSLRTAFESIYKDSARAAAELDYIRQVTNELGLEFYSTAESAKGFFAAAETSGLKENAEEIFHAFSSAVSALKMTDEKAASVFLAISQMLSKGKISAEEMRQQLGEHLPGAVQMLASAMGVSLQKLDKMFEAGEVGLENLLLLAREVEKVYGEAGAKAGDALLGQMNKLRSEWTDFKAQFVDSDEITNMLKSAREGVSFLTDNIEGLRKTVQSLAIGFSVAFAAGTLKGFAGALKNVVFLTQSLRNFNLAGIFSVKGITGIGALATVIAGIWTVWNDGAEKAKYSVADFRNGITGLREGLDDLGEEASKTSEKLTKLYKTNLETSITNLKKDIAETTNSFGNAVKAIQNSSFSIDSPNNMSVQFALSEENKKIQEQRKLVWEVADAFDELSNKFKSGSISLTEFTIGAGNLRDKVVSAGLEGTSAFTSLQSVLTAVGGEFKDNYNLLNELEKKLNDLKGVVESFKAADTLKLFGDANSIALDNIYKSAQLGNDKRLESYIKFLTSGNLKDSGGKKYEFKADDLKSMYDAHIKGTEDIAVALQTRFGVEKSVTDALDKQVSLEKQLDEQRKSSSKTIANRVRLEEDYAATLSGLMAKYNEMQKLQGLPMDSLERSLVEVGIKATELDTKLEKLKNKMVKDKVDPSTMALIELYSKQVNAAEIQDQLAEKYQPLVEQAKSAWNEIAEANGITNQLILDDTEKTYEEMLKAIDEMRAMDKISAEEHAAYLAGINEQVARKRLELDTSWEAGLKQGAQDMRDEVSNYAKQWADVGKNAFTDLGNALADFATNTKKSWSDLGDAFSDLAQSIINNIAKIATQTMASNLYSGLFGGASGGGLLSGLVGSIGGLFGFADGGVMPAGTLSAYSNGVYSSPTYFSMTGVQRFAKGGVFGEAGPEAIMPLTTLPNGRLGVAATGMGGDVQINIINSTGEKVSTRQSNSTGGGKTIDVMIGDVVAKQMSTPGTKLNRSVSAQTGAKQQVVRR